MNPKDIREALEKQRREIKELLARAWKAARPVGKRGES